MGSQILEQTSESFELGWLFLSSQSGTLLIFYILSQMLMLFAPWPLPPSFKDSSAHCSFFFQCVFFKNLWLMTIIFFFFLRGVDDCDFPKTVGRIFVLQISLDLSSPQPKEHFSYNFSIPASQPLATNNQPSLSLWTFYINGNIQYVLFCVFFQLEASVFRFHSCYSTC